MKKNIKKVAGAMMLTLTISTVLSGIVFADTQVANQQRNNICPYSEDCPRNGEGYGLKNGPRDGSRMGPKDGTGIRAQNGTCVLQTEE